MTKIIFVAGSSRNTGKTSFCLSFLSYLLEEKYFKPEELACK
jgi:hypothetical protein